MGLFDGLGGAAVAGGLLGGIGLGAVGGNALYGAMGTQAFQAPAMDQGSQNQITSEENSLSQTPQQNTAAIMNGTQNAGSVQDVSQAQGKEQMSQGGGGIPGMSGAISAKAAKNFATQQGGLQTKAALQGQMMTNQNLNTAAANAVALSNAQNNVQNMTNQFQLQANASRYAVISGLMKGAGSAAGGMAGGAGGGGDMGTGDALNGSESAFTNPTEGNESYFNPSSSPSNFSGGMNSDYSF